MQVITENLVFWLVLLAVGTVVWLVQYKFRLATPNPFKNRAQIPPREQLIAHGCNERDVDDAIGIWIEMAQAYQIDPMQLRADDKIADIVSRDWFGDSGLAIEAKLTVVGGAMPSDATLFDLVQLLTKHGKS